MLTALTLTLASLSPSWLADAPVADPIHSARLLEIDDRLGALNADAWSTASIAAAVTGFTVAGAAIILAPIMAVSSFVGLFFAFGLATLAGVGLIVGVVSCIVGAVGLSHRRDERAALLEERAQLVASPPMPLGVEHLVPVQGAILARW